MLQGALGSHILELLAREVPERPARGGQDHAFHVFPAMAFKRLKDGAVLTVDGEDADVVFLGLRLHQGSGHDHRFFIGECDLFAGSDRRQRGDKACSADDGGNHQFSVRRLRHLCHPFLAGEDLDGEVGAALSQFFCGGFVG